MAELTPRMKELVQPYLAGIEPYDPNFTPTRINPLSRWPKGFLWNLPDASFYLLKSTEEYCGAYFQIYIKLKSNVFNNLNPWHYKDAGT